MKKINSVAAFIIILTAVSCSQSGDPVTLDINTLLTTSDSVTVHLEYSKEIYVDNATSVKFDSVKSDSRCPMDANCVWAGNGEAVLKLSSAGPARYVSVNTLLEPRSVQFGNYNLFLKSLNPYPAHAGIPIKQEEYSVDLLISRIK